MKWAKLLGSLAIIYHLIVVLVVPSRDSYLFGVVEPFVIKYANQINFNTAWQFFSPEPAPTTYLIAKVIKNGAEIAEYSIPEEKDVHTFRQEFNRRIAAMRFMSKDTERTRQILIPYVCALYPDATEIIVDRAIILAPSLEAVRQGAKLNSLENPVGEELIRDNCDRGELVEEGL